VFFPQLEIVALKPLLLFVRRFQVSQYDFSFQVTPGTIEHNVMVPDSE